MISSTQKFAEQDGLFSYSLFYDHIINIFKTMDEDWRADTLSWWQRYAWFSHNENSLNLPVQECLW